VREVGSLSCGVIAAILGVMPSARADDIFREDFQALPNASTLRCRGGSGPGTYAFPTDWLLRNVDQHPPAETSKWVTHAWEVRDDFHFDRSQCAMFSTSWYAPTGQADDWAWTPPILVPIGFSALTWRAIAYDNDFPDGYEVRLMASPDTPGGGDGQLGNQVSASTLLLSVAAESPVWTSHALPLQSYQGQTVRIGFRNHSNDRFVLGIDDVAVVLHTNLVASAAPHIGDYARAPAGFSFSVMPAVTAVNAGAETLTGVSGQATVLRDGVAVAPPTFSNAVSSLPMASAAALTFPTDGIFSGVGTWSVQYDLSAAQPESNIADNRLQVTGTEIGGNELSRYEETTGTLGIGTGDGGEIGVIFVLANSARFEGVRFEFGPRAPSQPPDPPDNWPGKPVHANLYRVNAMTGKPLEQLDSTASITTTYPGGHYEVAFASGPHVLTAGAYLVSVAEPAGTAVAMPLDVSERRFKLGTTLANWPTNPLGDWANLEDFGPYFHVMPGIGLLGELPLFASGFEETVSAGVRTYVSRAGAAREPATRDPAPIALGRPHRP
jgi:hypothetical protein